MTVDLFKKRFEEFANIYPDAKVCVIRHEEGEVPRDLYVKKVTSAGTLECEEGEHESLNAESVLSYLNGIDPSLYIDVDWEDECIEMDENDAFEYDETTNEIYLHSVMIEDECDDEDDEDE